MNGGFFVLGFRCRFIQGKGGEGCDVQVGM